MNDAQEKQNEGKGRSKKIKENKRKQKKAKENKRKLIIFRNQAFSMD
jgi:hypothetical protein